jgi:alanyl-tRNA synthetase
LEGSSSVVALFKGGESVSELTAGESGVVVLDNTPFYAESGGQAGDHGTLSWDSGQFTVTDCTKEQKNHLHIGQLTEGVLRVGATVSTTVDMANRKATALNHSATHLLHAALRDVLGDHVQQKGSLVNAERLRFDFAHFEAVSAQELEAVEQMVNQYIRQNSPVTTELMAIDEAKGKGAMALFGEKYDDEVRVLTMGDGFSVELCGGTHAQRTGDIGLLKIVSESGIASGVRRIEAVTGEGALAYLNQGEQALSDIAGVLKGSRDSVVDKVKGLSERNRQLEKELDQLKAKLTAAKSGDMAANAETINGIKVLVAKLEGVEAKALRDTIDQLKNKLGSAVVVLAAEENGKISVAAGVTKDLISRIKAGDLVKELTAKLGGKGGGRPDFAQGGGTDVAALPEALASVKATVANV